jgi:exopolyphosphatase/guanosine-5'-triphosphate,3'-diphosphate pyrophosphatase
LSVPTPTAGARRLATIDLGTNTVRYLLVEIDGRRADWLVIDQDQRVTRLGEGLAAAGRLGEAPMARTGAAVHEYAERARRLGAAEVRVVATSAVREAVNGREFAAGLERATGVRIAIVSGEAEARLTVRGVLAGLRNVAAPLIVFDVGGGSTEFIRWRDGAVAAATSLRLGVVPLAERYPFPKPVEWDRYGALVREIRDRLARELSPAITASPVETLVGTAGTVTTLAALDLGLDAYDAGRVQGHRLTRAAIDTQLRRLGALDLTGRAALPCLEPGRADLIVPGVAIVTATMERLAAEALVVSDWSLREGIVAELVEARR